MKLFKEAKKQPIKLRGFKFIGFHPDYETCGYYYKELPKDNFEFAEVMFEGQVKRGKLYKAELGAGTKINILDAFMSNYLYNKINKIKVKDNKDFVHKVTTTTFKDEEKKTKDSIVKKFTSPVPDEIKKMSAYKKFIDRGYELLYCSDDETNIRRFSIVNIVLVKDEHVKSTDNRIEIDRHYTLFQPLKYMTTPGYIKGESKIKYHEEELPPIVVNNDILEK